MEHSKRLIYIKNQKGLEFMKKFMAMVLAVLMMCTLPAFAASLEDANVKTVYTRGKDIQLSFTITEAFEKAEVFVNGNESASAEFSAEEGKEIYGVTLPDSAFPYFGENKVTLKVTTASGTSESISYVNILKVPSVVSTARSYDFAIGGAKWAAAANLGISYSDASETNKDSSFGDCEDAIDSSKTTAALRWNLGNTSKKFFISRASTVFTDTETANPVVFSFYTRAGSTGNILNVERKATGGFPTKATFNIFNSNGFFASSDKAYDANKWYHAEIYIDVNNNIARTMIDGEVVWEGNADSGKKHGWNPLKFEAIQCSGTGGYFDIDEIYMYTVADAKQDIDVSGIVGDNEEELSEKEETLEISEFANAVKINFDKVVTDATADNVYITNAKGEKISGTVVADGSSVTVAITKALTEGESYTLYAGGTLKENGAALGKMHRKTLLAVKGGFSILAPVGTVSESAVKLQVGAPDAERVEFYIDGAKIKEFDGGEKIYSHTASTEGWTYGRKEFKAIILNSDGSRQSKRTSFDFKDYSLDTTFNAMFGATDKVGFSVTTGTESIIQRSEDDYAYEMDGNGFISRGLSVAGSGGGHSLLIFDIDMKFYSLEDAADLEFKLVKSDGSNAFLVPISSKIFGGTAGGNKIAGTDKTFDNTSWHDVRVIFDFENLTQTMYFDNEFVTSATLPEALKNYQYLSNFKVNVYDIGTTSKPGVAIDNVKISKATVAPEFTASYDGVLVENDVIPNNGAILSMQFDKELTITPASHVILKLNGTQVQSPEVSYISADKSLSIALADLNLEKNSILDVEISSDVLVDGQKLDRGMHRRFYIGDEDGFYVGGTNIQVNGNVVSSLADYINSTGEEKPLYLLTATYNENKTKTYNVDIAEHKNASVGFGSIESHIPVSAEAKKASAFLWETTFEPICTNVEINVNAE